MKSSIFKNKVNRKNILPGQLATKLLVTGTKDKKMILPEYGPQKVGNHRSTISFLKKSLVLRQTVTICNRLKFPTQKLSDDIILDSSAIKLTFLSTDFQPFIFS
jgi:hypothetical protein